MALTALLILVLLLLVGLALGKLSKMRYREKVSASFEMIVPLNEASPSPQDPEIFTDPETGWTKFTPFSQVFEDAKKATKQDSGSSDNAS